MPSYGQQTGPGCQHLVVVYIFLCLQELDDTAAFRNAPSKWGDDIEFPLPFGRTLTAAEEYVHSLDESTGASLKFTVLNPKGRVWLMVAGGGASVIYAGAALAGDNIVLIVIYLVIGASCCGSTSGHESGIQLAACLPGHSAYSLFGCM